MPNNTYQTVWNPTLNALPQDERGYYKLSQIAAPNRQSVGQPYYRVLNVVANSVSPSVGHPWTTAALAPNPPNFSGQEIPIGAIDGVNKTFTLRKSTVDPSTFFGTVNDKILVSTVDYTLVGQTITLSVAPPKYAWFFVYYAYHS